ncbi:hypothetical protein [Thermococcus sp. 2319x1]|uniref:hypothetical protein n=1 Tax=Thermococcus sp. 2319x1 TaxID=1674923 RepID=UPI001E43B471|nr:hypothetical protein [Thermococcus sp. 2319x1]
MFSLFFSFFRLLMIIPKTLWQLAGMKRAVKRAKRKFKKTLIKNGLPKELAEELADEYAILDEMLSIGGILKLIKTSWRTGRNTPAFPKAR